jgi:hypothetical protein
VRQTPTKFREFLIIGCKIFVERNAEISTQTNTNYKPPLMDVFVKTYWLIYDRAV